MGSEVRATVTVAMKNLRAKGTPTQLTLEEKQAVAATRKRMGEGHLFMSSAEKSQKVRRRVRVA